MAKKLTIREIFDQDLKEEGLAFHFDPLKYGIYVSPSGEVKYIQGGVNSSDDDWRFVCTVGGNNIKETPEYEYWERECEEKKTELDAQLDDKTITKKDYDWEMEELEEEPTAESLGLIDFMRQTIDVEDLCKNIEEIPFGFFDDEDSWDKGLKQLKKKYKGIKIWYHAGKEIDYEENLISHDIWVTPEGKIIYSCIGRKYFNFDIYEYDDGEMVKELKEKNVKINFFPPYKMDITYIKTKHILAERKKAKRRIA